MLGKMRVFKLEKKNSTDVAPRTVKGYLYNPSTKQKAWYQFQNNVRLMGTIEFSGNIDDFINFDSVTISNGKKYRLSNVSQKTFGRVKGEVVI
ncbi:tail protein [Leuconostoc phage CHB]|uniref:Tail protein n=2 Tax=Unaquatrovirus LN34 TaxID=2170248 RepID=A0A219VHK7_9CAUD|nr:tail protein [Leuconostoc phage LN34]AFY98427.1 phage tail protein [Leuconostoc phage LN34]AOT27936.1 tail protein [Leuconostoc phage CHB]